MSQSKRIYSYPTGPDTESMAARRPEVEHKVEHLFLAGEEFQEMLTIARLARDRILFRQATPHPLTFELTEAGLGRKPRRG